MKWITHQTGAFLGAAVLALPLPGILSAGFGAIFPDLIDQKLSRLIGGKRGCQKVFNQIHRGASHWFGWWLVLFAACQMLAMPELIRDIAFGFCFGALSHAGLDLLTPAGVPLLPFTKKIKIALPVCSTGKAGEYLFLAAMLGAGAWYFRDALQLFFRALAS